jgi:hypothetical protein
MHVDLQPRGITEGLHDVHDTGNIFPFWVGEDHRVISIH